MWLFAKATSTASSVRNGAGKPPSSRSITQLIQETNGSLPCFSNRSQWTQASNVSDPSLKVLWLTSIWPPTKTWSNIARPYSESWPGHQRTPWTMWARIIRKKKFRDFFFRMRTTVGIAICPDCPTSSSWTNPSMAFDPESRSSVKWSSASMMNSADHPHFQSHPPNFIWLPIVLAFVDQGRLIKEIKAEFEEQGEDYIILKTSHCLPGQLIQDQLHHRIKVIDRMEIHIFGQTHGY